MCTGSISLSKAKAASYLDGVSALSQGKWIEAASIFDNVLAVDPLHNRASVNFARAVTSAYRHSNALAGRLTDAELRLKAVLSRSENSEWHSLMGEVLSCLAENKVSPERELGGYAPESLREGLLLWNQAIEEFRIGGQPEDGMQAQTEVARISKFLNHYSETCSSRADIIFRRFRNGDILLRNEIDLAEVEIDKGLRYDPESIRLLTMQDSLNLVKSETLSRTWACVSLAQRLGHWNESIDWANWVLDLDPEESRAREAISWAKFKMQVKTVIALLRLYDQGENPSGVDYRQGFLDLNLARKHMPGSIQADSLEVALESAMEGTINRLCLLMDDALASKRWEVALSLSDETLDIHHNASRAFACKVEARAYIDTIQFKLADMKTAKNTEDVVLLRQTCNWLMENTSTPRLYEKEAIDANRGIFAESLESKDWETVEDCVDFAKSHGEDTTDLDRQLFLSRYRVEIYLIAAILFLFIAGLSILLIHIYRRGRDQFLDHRVKRMIHQRKLQRAIKTLRKSTNTESKGRVELLGKLWTLLLEQDGIENIIQEIEWRKQVSDSLDTLFDGVTNLEAKIKIAQTALQISWPSILWREGLDTFRKRRDALRVVPEMWNIPFLHYQKCIGTRIQGLDLAEELDVLFDEMAEDLKAWLDHFGQSTEELISLIQFALNHPAGSKVRMVLAVAYAKEDKWEKALPCLLPFFKRTEDLAGDYDFSDLLDRWSAHIALKAGNLTRNESSALAELLIRGFVDEEHQKACFCRLYEYIDGLEENEGEKETIRILKRIYQNGVLPIEGKFRLGDAYRRRKILKEEEGELLCEIIKHNGDLELWLYYLEVVGRHRSALELQTAITDCAMIPLMNVKSLENVVTRIVAGK